MTDLSQLRALGLFDARVPRYTSYPTAARFTGAVGASHTRAWLAEVPPGARISLYLHVPFCRRLCWFCACRTQGTASAAPVAAYVDTLRAEIALIRAALPGPVELGQVHFGGGTPTLMTPAMIADLWAAIGTLGTPAADAEISVEIDPNEIDGERLDALVEMGMTRASIGVQDFDPVIQAAIGRDQTFEVTEAAVTALRDRGVRSLNVDILYGLPHQTLAGIRRGVGQVLSLAPDRVALYGYAHVPWMAKRQVMIPSEALPVPEARLDLFEAASGMFLDAGYRAVGIDHFALPADSMAQAEAEGRLRRNFQGYTTDSAEVLIGLGASAISRYPQGHAQNAPGTGDYTARIRDGRLASSRGHVFAGEDVFRARAIEALMCQFRVDLAALAAETGVPAAVASLLAAELAAAFPRRVARNGAAVAILQDARAIARLVARKLDAYAFEEAGHSPAV